MNIKKLQKETSKMEQALARIHAQPEIEAYLRRMPLAMKQSISRNLGGVATSGLTKISSTQMAYYNRYVEVHLRSAIYIHGMNLETLMREVLLEAKLNQLKHVEASMETELPKVTPRLKPMYMKVYAQELGKITEPEGKSYDNIYYYLMETEENKGNTSGELEEPYQNQLNGASAQNLFDIPDIFPVKLPAEWEEE